MKKLIVFAAALTMLALLSCARTDTIDPHSTDHVDTTASDHAQGLTYEEAQQIAEKIFTPSAEGASAANDDVVYRRWNTTLEYSVTTLTDDSGVSHLYVMYSSAGKEPVMLCTDEECDHMDMRCTAFAGRGVVSLVAQNGKNETVVYYTTGMESTINIGGQTVALDGVKWERASSSMAIFEYNLDTGARRCVVSRLRTMLLLPEIYYNGRLYAYQTFDCPLYSIDVVTGEYTQVESENYLRPIGAYDKRVYFFGENGTLYSSNEDLSDMITVEEFGDSGAANPLVASMGGNNFYFIADEQYETDSEGNKTGSARCDLCKYDVSDPSAEAEIIAERVDGNRFEIYGNYVYYTKYDPHSYGYYGAIEIASKTGGTLYRYDALTGKTETVFEDCGGDVEVIYYIDNEKIVFTGDYYGGLADGYQYVDENDIYKTFIYHFALNDLMVQ